jgi:hypothetical protein
LKEEMIGSHTIWDIQELHAKLIGKDHSGDIDIDIKGK